MKQFFKGENSQETYLVVSTLHGEHIFYRDKGMLKMSDSRQNAQETCLVVGRMFVNHVL